ncbi:YdhK family protein [Geomicrobium sediminis]|uniref:DUF1541 domain-containing protein n=1 Tax=Geomicrobium sediminis TaxID=1347788 RepID=A0ABS2PHI2_9BACL|nr:YdhK family protein [Geomicrobium sediminis]EZH64205.1 lipoprotein [Bacillaceae bacterium JMAK1]MBM7634273.1 hypothetical protein [Geomicrobium sediminis]
MRKPKKSIILTVSLGTAIMLAACGNGDDEPNPEMDMDPGSEDSMDDMEDHDMGDMDMEDDMHEGHDMSSSGEVPDDLEEAENPTFEVGSQALITDGHMPEMEDVEATIVGAYDTTVYTVSYTPTTGGDRVEDHEWVVHEELEDVGEEPLEPGEEATLNASHMEGMEGATAEIDSAEETTVYMVDFTSTDGEEVENHKWVTESELSPVE